MGVMGAMIAPLVGANTLKVNIANAPRVNIACRNCSVLLAKYLNLNKFLDFILSLLSLGIDYRFWEEVELLFRIAECSRGIVPGLKALIFESNIKTSLNIRI